MHTIALLIPFIAGGWVFMDARARGKNVIEALFWGVGTFIMLIIVLPLWLLLRPARLVVTADGHRSADKYWNPGPKQQPLFCSSCQRPIAGLEEPQFCPYCGHRLTQRPDPVITIDPDHNDRKTS